MICQGAIFYVLLFRESVTHLEKSGNVTMVGKVTLSSKEQKRLIVLYKALAGQMTGREVAEMLGLALRRGHNPNDS